MSMTDPSRLTDADLMAGIASLAGAARGATASLVAHLAELEARGLHLAQGFRSLYGYCRHVLHLSEHEAYNRMEAAHVSRRFPVILALLSEGHLHLTAVCQLAPHLGDEDHLALLGGAIHRSKREVEELLARWFPKPAVATFVRKVSERQRPVEGAPAVLPLPASGGGPAPAALLLQGSGGGPAPAACASSRGVEEVVLAAPATPSRPVSRPPRSSIDPLSSDLYQVRFTATAATIAKLKCAQELLSHAVPGGDAGEILDRALDALLEQAGRQKHAATGRPRPGRPVARASRTVPAAVEREVWRRDDGRCAFTAANGRRCEERRFVEFHHVKPWIAGGPPTVGNIALRCRAHNAYEASLYFAPIREAMDARTRSGTSSGRSGGGPR